MYQKLEWENRVEKVVSIIQHQSRFRLQDLPAENAIPFPPAYAAVS